MSAKSCFELEAGIMFPEMASRKMALVMRGEAALVAEAGMRLLEVWFGNMMSMVEVGVVSLEMRLSVIGLVIKSWAVSRLEAVLVTVSIYEA
jgi:hypothetical protein